MKKLGLLFISILLSSCASYYYSGYDESYYASNFPGYQQRQSQSQTSTQSRSRPQPQLHVRPLNTHDFYMMDNHPGEYFDEQVWNAASGVSSYAIHNFFQGFFH